MFERIMVPLDGSKVGEAALPFVEELVSKLQPEPKLEVTLLVLRKNLMKAWKKRSTHPQNL